MSSGPSDRSWLWLLAAGLLTAAGVFALVATRLWWTPCRSSMLVGTILEPAGAPEFSHRCLVRMDAGTPYPLPAATDGAPPELYGFVAAAILLAALAWSVALVATSMPRSARWAGLALAASLAALGVAGLRPVSRVGDPSIVGTTAFWVIDVVTVVWLACVCRGPVSWSPRTTIRLLLLLGGATAFGALRGMVDYAVMITWSQANWDVPPGTGFAPALVLILCGVGVAVVTLGGAPAERSAPTAAEQVQQVGPVA